jgi:uncharacterized LabA/DUF88 family protein
MANMKVYVDGENFIHSLTDVLRKHNKIKSRSDIKAFDLMGLCREALGLRDPEIFYYTTKLREAEEETHGKLVADKSKEIIAWVSGWNTMLLEQGIEVVRAGHLKIREAFPCPECGHVRHVFQEKGVDVRLAVDLVLAAGEGVNLSIFSSDSDLIPAVHAAKDRGSRVKNLAPADLLNLGLARTCGEWQIVTDEQFLKAYERAQRKMKAAAKTEDHPEPHNPAPDSNDPLSIIHAEQEKHHHGHEA